MEAAVAAIEAIRAILCTALLALALAGCGTTHPTAQTRWTATPGGSSDGGGGSGGGGAGGM
jgi:uncharacterized membrane protein YgcG